MLSPKETTKRITIFWPVFPHHPSDYFNLLVPSTYNPKLFVVPTAAGGVISRFSMHFLKKVNYK
jgi:hypothetical protein